MGKIGNSLIEIRSRARAQGPLGRMNVHARGMECCCCAGRHYADDQLYLLTSFLSGEKKSSREEKTFQR